MRISDWSSDVCSSDLLIQQIQETGLANRISLPGRTEQPWQEMVKADIFVLTSQVEGFPNVLLEAMALGRACVTVDCPSGPRELSQDEIGRAACRERVCQDS